MAVETWRGENSSVECFGDGGLVVSLCIFCKVDGGKNED